MNNLNNKKIKKLDSNQVTGLIDSDGGFLSRLQRIKDS